MVSHRVCIKQIELAYFQKICSFPNMEIKNEIQKNLSNKQPQAIITTLTHREPTPQAGDGKKLVFSLLLLVSAPRMS